MRFLSLYAKGLTTGEISSHFAEIYGASVSRETISVRVKDSSQPARKRPDFQFWCEQVHWFSSGCGRDGGGSSAPMEIAVGVRHPANQGRQRDWRKADWLCRRPLR